MKKRLPFAEELVYFGSVILTFGMTWIVKIIIKKAIMEAHNAKEQ